MRIFSNLLLSPLLVVFAAALVLPNLCSAGTTEEPSLKYIGAKGCKFCHSKERGGLIYEAWEASAHAKAFDVLGEAHQANEACLGCHTTGPGGPIAAGTTPEMLQGVQCEACHGPGSAYKSMMVMKNHDAAVQSGLIVPTAETCQGCHREDLPKECRGTADAPRAFDFEAAYGRIEHHLPAKR